MSGNYALEVAAGTPMMAAFTTSAPYPDYGTNEFSDSTQTWTHYPESEDTLYVGSWRIGNQAVPAIKRRRKTETVV